MFKIVDLPGERHAVRISNDFESATYATLLAFPDLRMEATDDTVVTFYELKTADSRASSMVLSRTSRRSGIRLPREAADGIRF